jgi:carboxyl-terminal processing protease
MRIITKSLVLAALLVTVSMPAFAAEEAKPAKPQDPKDTIRLLELFGDVFEKVREEYVEAPNESELIENAINGMLTSLDPHSSYLNDKDFKEMQVQTKGEFGGLGIEVTMEKGLVKVVSPLDDTPASKAGLKSGDLISHIDGDSVAGMTLNEAVEKMRGKVGTQIVLTILRDGMKEPFEAKMQRDVIKIQSVRGKQQGDVAYVRITSFSEQTSKLMEKEIRKQQKELGEKLRGLVLDLRNNPGGLLDQAIEVSDMLLEKGEVVSTRGRHAENTKRFNATKGDVLGGLPVVVLINGGSASASEIVAGALQDHRRAIVMGTKSFGKGSVQTVIPLPDNTAMRLTTSKYYTPSGHSIQAKGITPDIEVEPAKLEPIKNNFPRMDEASLKGHLAGEGEEAPIVQPEEEPVKKEKEKDKDKDKSKDKDKDAESKLYEEDYQLARAVDLLRALNLYRASLEEKKQ